ncbi:hypothetical protein QAD02_010596 [Eretmocerus hayati]|uniref:Uncharacterized protein n=1 Tax=Eretmocerus hayati TaxID=131215 RepID=A0ACC2NUF5_9HYME|nr:hypothetical protein QAD02_010596 [Eretmocerus hayati]
MQTETITEQEDSPKIKTTSVKLEADEPTPLPEEKEADQPWIYSNILGLAFLHIAPWYMFFTRYHEAKLYTWIFNIAFIFVSGIGVTAGAHRLWAHRSYSAKLPLRIWLALCFLMTGQTHMHKWIRDHRTHHKFTETKADPHDSTRGFFFSHVGWLMMKRHPAVIKYGKKIDMSDIEADPVIQYFDKWYELKMTLMCFIIPTLIPVYFWDEKLDIAFWAVMLRYVSVLNFIFSVNSWAHFAGNKPYNKSFRARENPIVSFFSLGEGWHNYHHAFPWDYKTSEFGGYGLNLTTGFIELMALLGLAYDLKTPSKQVIHKVTLNKGDGTTSPWGLDHRGEKVQ